MSVSTVYVGRAPGSAVTDTGTITEDQLRVCVFNRISEHLWLSRIGARLGVFSGANIQYRLVAYRGTPDHVPDRRLAYVGLHTTNTVMTTATEGANVEWPVDWVDVGPTQLAAQLYTNIYVGLGIEQDTAGSLGHGMIGAANITADEERFFNQFGVDIPPDPFGAYSSSNEGHLSIWGVCHTNEAPRVPIGRTANTSSGDLTPTLEADFRDRNGVWGPGNEGFNDGDRAKNVNIQFRRQSDKQMFWDETYAATSLEQTNNRTTRLYNGTTLIRGTAYEWRIRHSDQFDAWGDYSDWLAYTPPTAGTVTINSAHTPTGKQEAINGYTFQFIWNHNLGLATNGLKLRIKQNGAIIRENGIWKADTTAAGATGTITFAETLFDDLPWGGNFTVAIKGRATDNQESNWSNEHAFTTDAAPTVPAGFSPQGGTVFTMFPLLQVGWTDSDDTTLTGLTGTFEITRPNATVVSVTPTYNAVSKEWEFQTTAVELDQFGTYLWRARSFDGTLYSGVTTVAGDTTWGGPVSFQYLAGPDVALVSPISNATITTSTPTVSWTAATQTKYRLQLIHPDTGLPIYDSGLITSMAQSAVLPAGYWHNTEVRDITIIVQDASALTGTSTSTNVTLTYVAPDDVNAFNAFGVAVGSDPWATTIRGEFEQTTEPVDTFLAYLIYRSDITDSPLQRISSPTQTVFQDFFPASGIEYVYTVTVLALRGAEEVESAGVTASVTLNLEGVVLVSLANPTGTRTVLTTVQQRDHVLRGTESVYMPWGAVTDPDTAPTTIRGKARYWETSGTYYLYDEFEVPVAQRRAELEQLATDGGTLSYRDEQGTSRFIVIPADSGISFKGQFLGHYIVDVRFRQENFRLSIPLEIA